MTRSRRPRARSALGAGLAGLAMLVAPAVAAQELMIRWFADGRAWARSYEPSGDHAVRSIWVGPDPARPDPAAYRLRIGYVTADGDAQAETARCRNGSYSLVCDLPDGRGTFRLARFGCELRLAVLRPLRLSDEGPAVGATGRRDFILRPARREGCAVQR